jgi:hypothetical protein
LPLRLLNFSLPPLLLSSSKSGALSPTSSAGAAELAAATTAIANAKENMSLAVDFIASSFLTKLRVNIIPNSDSYRFMSQFMGTVNRRNRRRMSLVF